MVQIEPFRCFDCGAVLNPLVNGEYLDGWVPEESEIVTKRVTGYYINARGSVIPMTHDRGHAEYNEMIGATTGRLLHSGWVRITNLEGYCVDLPPFMTSATRRALSETLRLIEHERGWGVPYVKAMADERGIEMHWAEVMALVSELPLEGVDVTAPTVWS